MKPIALFLAILLTTIFYSPLIICQTSNVNKLFRDSNYNLSNDFSFDDMLKTEMNKGLYYCYGFQPKQNKNLFKVEYNIDKMQTLYRNDYNNLDVTLANDYLNNISIVSIQEQRAKSSGKKVLHFMLGAVVGTLAGGFLAAAAVEPGDATGAALLGGAVAGCIGGGLLFVQFW